MAAAGPHQSKQRKASRRGSRCRCCHSSAIVERPECVPEQRDAVKEYFPSTTGFPLPHQTPRLRIVPPYVASVRDPHHANFKSRT